MRDEVKLKPGYDPDKYRDKLCEIFNKNQGSMSIQEYLAYRNEKVRKLFPHKEFICVGTELKTENKAKND